MSLREDSMNRKCLCDVDKLDSFHDALADGANLLEHGQMLKRVFLGETTATFEASHSLSLVVTRFQLSGCPLRLKRVRHSGPRD